MHWWSVGTLPSTPVVTLAPQAGLELWQCWLGPRPLWSSREVCSKLCSKLGTRGQHGMAKCLALNSKLAYSGLKDGLEDETACLQKTRLGSRGQREREENDLQGGFIYTVTHQDNAVWIEWHLCC